MHTKAAQQIFQIVSIPVRLTAVRAVWLQNKFGGLLDSPSVPKNAQRIHYVSG
jgi:hypothetical protein